MNTVKIYNAGDNFEIDRVVELLKEKDIECYIMESGIGGYLAIQQGFSIYGKDIYVLEENKEKAEEIIKKFKEDNRHNEDIDYNIKALNDKESKNYIESEDYKVPWYKNRVIVARIILIGGLVLGILSFLIR